MTFAFETAKYGDPEIQFSGVSPTVVMQWIVGFRRERVLLYSGDIIDTEEALRIGLVNQVVPDDELEDKTMRYARRVVTVDQVAV